jgi:excinuclease UvrABC ATPase subunit
MCTYYNVPIYFFGEKDDLGHAMGKEFRASLAVLDKGLADSIETSLELAEGNLTVDVIDGDELKFSENHACPICGFSIGELEPRMFSFNSPFGACPTCDGLGQKLTVRGLEIQLKKKIFY